MFRPHFRPNAIKPITTACLHTLLNTNTTHLLFVRISSRSGLYSKRWGDSFQNPIISPTVACTTNRFAKCQSPPQVCANRASRETKTHIHSWTYAICVDTIPAERCFGINWRGVVFNLTYGWIEYFNVWLENSSKNATTPTKRGR